MSNKLTIEDCHKTAAEKGGKFLSLEYKTASTKYLWQCENNHKWETKYITIRQGSWCPECRRCSIDDCYKIANEKMGKFLSNCFKTVHHKYLWECEKGHQWEAKMSNIQIGHWCPKCNIETKRNTLEHYQNLAASKGGKCLSEIYNNNKSKGLWVCSSGHKWVARFDDITNDHWCPECDNTRKISNTIEDCHIIAKEKGGKCLSDKYHIRSTKYKWQCSKGHIWMASFNNIKQSTWCPYCYYKTETKVREIIENITGKNFPKQKPKWLNGLELDGFNEELNIAFEYNGLQHYTECWIRDAEKLKKQKKSDKVKKQKCKNNNIELIIIPHWIKNLERYIYKKLSQLEVLDDSER